MESGCRRDSSRSVITVSSVTVSDPARSAHVRTNDVHLTPSTSTRSPSSTFRRRPTTPSRRMRTWSRGTAMNGVCSAGASSRRGRGRPRNTAAVGPQQNAPSGRARRRAAMRPRSSTLPASTRTPRWGLLHARERNVLGDSPSERPSAIVNAAERARDAGLDGILHLADSPRPSPDSLHTPSPPRPLAPAREGSVSVACDGLKRQELTPHAGEGGGGRGGRAGGREGWGVTRTSAGGAGCPRGAGRRPGRTTGAGSRSGRRPRRGPRRPRPARG